ncbi:MAG: hypothetical protein ISR51_00060 [Rhodospirillales bacterium]|nr:hypothetical protein [Alphaproteobacteria bacterium]MBL6947042.1 hypothetical protein [Rhodospirillales bacterium]
MVESFDKLIERFPGDDKALRSMFLEDHDLDVLSKEYRSIEEDLLKLESVGGTEALSEANGLKMRCIALEEDILTKFEGYKPI